MLKYEGFDANGDILIKEFPIYKWEDLPMKGLGKSMANVNFYESVIIPQRVVYEGVIWGYTEAEVRRRAYELNAEVKWMQIPSNNISDGDTYELWFEPISKN